jgi:hypothetical protein
MGLDPAVIASVMQKVQAIAETGIAILMVEQNAEAVHAGTLRRERPRSRHNRVLSGAGAAVGPTAEHVNQTVGRRAVKSGRIYT